MRYQLLLPMTLLMMGAFLLAGCATGPVDTEDDLIALDKAWAAAVVAKDVASVEKICSPELIYSHSDGRIDDYAIYINRLRQGSSNYQAIDISTISAKLYGDTAIVTARALFRVLSDGNQLNNDLAYTHVYQKRDGEWRMIAHQSARMPPAM